MLLFGVPRGGRTWALCCVRVNQGSITLKRRHSFVVAAALEEHAIAVAMLGLVESKVVSCLSPGSGPCFKYTREEEEQGSSKRITIRTEVVGDDVKLE